MRKYQKPLENSYSLPGVQVNKIEPTLEHKGRIFANLVELEWKIEDRVHILKVKERSNLPIHDCLNQTCEVLLEVTKADLLLNKKTERDIRLEGAVAAKYLGVKDSYIFFEKVVDWMNGQEEGYDEVGYDHVSIQAFDQFGPSGFGLTPYDSELMISTPNGTLLLNAYHFEDQLENVLPEETIGIRIHDAFLRSIRKST